MASMAMTASFLPATTKHPAATGTIGRRGAIVAKVSSSEEGGKRKLEAKKEASSQGRRELVAAAVTVAAATFTRAAMADEPKSGTLEAKQKYAPVCVTMPTARICHK